MVNLYSSDKVIDYSISLFACATASSIIKKRHRYACANIAARLKGKTHVYMLPKAIEYAQNKIRKNYKHLTTQKKKALLSNVHTRLLQPVLELILYIFLTAFQLLQHHLLHCLDTCLFRFTERITRSLSSRSLLLPRPLL
jgi:hypothetical protein